MNWKGHEINAINSWGFELSSTLDATIVKRLGGTLLHSVWQFAVIARLLVMCLRLLARRAAHVRRLALARHSPTHGNKVSVRIPAMLSIAAMVTVGFGWVGSSQATDSPKPEVEQQETWGPVSAGLQCRAVPVLASMPDDAIQLHAVHTTFDEPADVAFAVELKNVSDTPIKLCEPVHQIRNAQGKIEVINQFDWFSQYLFQVDFYREGKKIEQPECELVHWQLPYFSMASKTVAPGETRRFILRTTKWHSFMTTQLDGGKYATVVRYRGLPERTAKGFIAEKIESSIAGSWSGDVASTKVAFEVAQPSGPQFKQKLKWGEVQNGLRAAIELLPNKTRYAHGDRPLMKFHVENIRSQPVSFVSMTHLPDGSFQAFNEDGVMAKQNPGGSLSGFINSVRIRLQSKQRVTLDSGALLFADPEIIPEQFETRGHRRLIARPGTYEIRRSHSFGGFSKANKNPVLRAKDNWGGRSLMSGRLRVTVVAKTNADSDEPRSSVDDANYEDAIAEPLQPTKTQTDDNKDAQDGEAAKPDTVKKNEKPNPPLRSLQGTIIGLKGNVEGVDVTVTLSVAGNDTKSAADIRIPGTTVATLKYSPDKDGRYAVEIPPRLASNPALRLEAKITGPGLLSRSIGPMPVSDFDMKPIGNDQLYWLHRQMSRSAFQQTTLRKSKPIKGQIRLPDGSPLVGAKVVTATKYRPYSWKFHDSNDYSSSSETTTDALGNFAVGADKRATLTVTAPGRAPLLISDLHKYIEEHARDPLNTFVMPRTRKIVGNVLSELGGPIPRAIINIRLAVAYNEFDMPLSLQRFAVTDKNGWFESPPLPPGQYAVALSGQLAGAAELDAYRAAAAKKVAARPWDQKWVRLSDVFLGQSADLTNAPDESRVDFRPVKSHKIEVQIEYPDGRDDRTVDLTVVGTFKGQRWSGSNAKADAEGRATLRVPTGVTAVVVGTGLAKHRVRPGDETEIGEAIHLGEVTEDMSGIVVIQPKLAQLKVELDLPGNILQQNGKPKAFMRINVRHAKQGFRQQSAKKQKMYAVRSVQNGSSQYRGLVLPGEEIILEVNIQRDGKTTLLHEERLTLKPGEVRERKIKIKDK